MAGIANKPAFGICAGRSYRGWLPAVTGRLSFKVFGNTTHPSKALSANVSNGRQRYVCIVQLRKTGDAILANIGHDTEFVFCFTAKASSGLANEQEFLVGKVNVISKSQWEISKIVVERHQNLLSEHRRPLRETFALDESCEESAVATQEHLDQNSMCSAEIQISRTGTTDVKYDRRKRDELRADMPTDISTDLEKSASAQIFYFIKDIGHSHKHHNEHTDTLADLYRVTDDTESDLSWRTQTLYSIYRKVIEYRRNPQIETFNDCIGLIAYSKTFQKISEQELPSKKNQLPIYYSDEIVQSIEATQSKIERLSEERRMASDSSRNFFIAGLGILLAYIGLMQFVDPNKTRTVPEPILLFILKCFIRSPFKSCVVLCTIYLAYRWIYINWNKNRLETVYLRLTAYLQRAASIRLLVGICLTATVIFLFVLFD